MSREQLEQVKSIWEEKLAHYEHELAITSSASQKFELRDNIQECKKEINKINEKLESLSDSDTQEETTEPSINQCPYQGLKGSIPFLQVEGEWRFYIRDSHSRIKLFVLISPALSEIIEW